MQTATIQTNIDNDAILLLDRDPNNCFGIREALEKAGLKVYGRDSQQRAIHCLQNEDIALVLCGLATKDCDGINLIREIRNRRLHNQIVVVGEDDDEGSYCVQALEAGAEDFIMAPAPAASIVARVKRHLKRARRSQQSGFTMNVSKGELPGVLQYLEAEGKTGKLVVKSKENTAIICLNDGRLGMVKTPTCSGQDAVVEALCWGDLTATFHEVSLSPEEGEGGDSITGAVMNASVDVDEFEMARQELVAVKAIFCQGKAGSMDEAAGKVRVYQRALRGFTVEEILKSETSERQAVVWLQELLAEGWIRNGVPLFEDYLKSCQAQYRKSHADSQVHQVKSCIVNVDFPLPEPPVNLPISGADWLAPTPKLVVGGDNATHVALFVASLVDISTHILQLRPPTKNLHGAELTRLSFSDDCQLDILRLPPSIDRRLLTALPDQFLDAVAVVYLVSAQDSKTCGSNLRVLRQLWNMFRGVYYLVVPQVPTMNDEYVYRIDCATCSHKLGVDMGHAGAVGECPVCAHTLIIPDCLDHLVHSFKLPEAVPAVMLQPHAAKHCRDLLLFIIDSVLEAAPPRERKKKRELSMDEKLSTQILTQTAVQTRPTKVAPEIQAEPETGPEDGTEMDQALSAILNDEGEEPLTGDFAEILAADTSSFDIDEFINKVKGEPQE